jgi:hypothetical protein
VVPQLILIDMRRFLYPRRRVCSNLISSSYSIPALCSAYPRRSALVSRMHDGSRKSFVECSVQ